MGKLRVIKDVWQPIGEAEDWTYSCQNFTVHDGDTLKNVEILLQPKRVRFNNCGHAVWDMGFGIHLQAATPVSIYRVRAMRAVAISAPELGTTAGAAAKRWLEDRCMDICAANPGGHLRIRTFVDRRSNPRSGKYGRILYDIINENGESLNNDMFLAKHASLYKS